MACAHYAGVCQAVCPVDAFYTCPTGWLHRKHLHRLRLLLLRGPFGAPQYPRVSNFGSRQDGQMHLLLAVRRGRQYGRIRNADQPSGWGKLPLCAEMCSTKSLLAGDGDILSANLQERVLKRGYGSGAWGWTIAYRETGVS
jgi:formate dehydrogenase iron-sulfur subunit